MSTTSNLLLGEEFGRQRLKELDVLKGIGILLMVYDHATGGTVEYLHKYIQSFHMPLFFMVSGYLYVSKPLYEEFRKRTVTLLKPWFIFASIYSICWLLIGVFRKTYIVKNIITVFCFPTMAEWTGFASPIWFLLCLYLDDMLFTVIDNTFITLKKKAISVLVLTFLGIIYSKFDFLPVLPFCLEAVCASISFFFIGYVIRELKLKLKLNWKFTFAAVVLHMILVGVNGCVDVRSARYMIVVLFFINAFMGVYIFYCASMYIKSHMPVFCKPFLHKIAKSFCRLLHLHFVGNCKTSAGSYSASHKPLQIIFSCYNTRYGNGSSEFSSSCAYSLK